MNPARYRLLEHADLLDVQRCKPRDWLALDDDFKDWPECCPDKYVRTDEVLGISASAVFDELQSHLARIYKVGA